MRQAALFETAAPLLPEGFRYETEFLSEAEEDALLARFAELPFAEAEYREYTAKRRVVSYGHRYDFSSNVLLPAEPLPDWLLPLRARVARWAGQPAERYTQALVTEYRPGTQLGWHRDVPDFDRIAACSLGGACRMRLRRWPHETGSKERSLAVTIAPRSVYAIEGAARWSWQHAISPTKEPRWSISFRTRSARQRPA